MWLFYSGSQRLFFLFSNLYTWHGLNKWWYFADDIFILKHFHLCNTFIQISSRFGPNSSSLNLIKWWPDDGQVSFYGFLWLHDVSIDNGDCVHGLIYTYLLGLLRLFQRMYIYIYIYIYMCVCVCNRRMNMVMIHLHEHVKINPIGIIVIISLQPIWVMSYITLFKEIRSWQVPYNLVGTPLDIRLAILHIMWGNWAFGALVYKLLSENHKDINCNKR